MAYKYRDIPITNHSSNCTQYYFVEWKLSTDTGYNSMNWTAEPPIRIQPLIEASIYDYRITRFCCNGTQSVPLTGSFNTTTDSPILDQPVNFSLIVGVAELGADCDDVTDADEYVFELAEDEEFTVNFLQIVSAISSTTFVGLTPGTLYYGRVKARASGFQDSPYSATDSATPS